VSLILMPNVQAESRAAGMPQSESTLPFELNPSSLPEAAAARALQLVVRRRRCSFLYARVPLKPPLPLLNSAPA
jgi:hypothetical protein